jgi:intein-encoded DNA endonuclease-like protein
MKLNGEEIQKLYLSGLSTVILSQNYGVTKEAILYHLHKLKTPMRHSPGVSEPLICEGYLNGNSTIELGKVWGCSHTRIAYILKRNNIPIRTKKEALEKNVDIYFMEKYKRKRKDILRHTIKESAEN